MTGWSGATLAPFDEPIYVTRPLLPLPIDHRYGSEAMDTLAHSVLQVLR